MKHCCEALQMQTENSKCKTQSLKLEVQTSNFKI